MSTAERSHIKETYRKRAANYDITANLYYLIGYREWKYRRETVEALHLEPGNTVVEIGCGTGLNFKLYQEQIGPRGRIIGVDLTDAMLEQARQRVQKNGWQNVELVNQDALQYAFPAGVDAVTSTFALSLIPEAPQIVERASAALADGGRIAIADFELPPNWPDWLIRLGLKLVEPFGATMDWVDKRPWEGIQAAMYDTLESVMIDYYYLDTTYIISGDAKR